MAKNKKYENALLISLVIVFYALIGLGLWVFKTLPLLPIIVLIITPILSFLILRNDQSANMKEETEIFIGGLLVLSIICSVLIYTNNHRSESSLAAVFLDGKVKKEKVFYEAEGEVVNHYENQYDFVAKTKAGELGVEAISWSLRILSLGCIYLNWRFWNRAYSIRAATKKPRYFS